MAASLGLDTTTQTPECGFYLAQESQGLTLRHARTDNRDRGLRIDFLDGSVERRLASGRRSPLARALALRRRPQPRVLDATCGLGRDSATLAALGCAVTALERHPVLFALLSDALERARRADAPPTWLARWAVLEHADAATWLGADDAGRFDIVYIDPMFEAARRKARPQKALAWLNELIGADADARDLLAIARRRAERQTVVKQHARAAPLAPPDRQVQGKAVRFDIYIA